MSSVIIAALYQFQDFPNYKRVKNILKKYCIEQGILGTLILASEGINGTVSGTRAGIDALKNYLIYTLNFRSMEYKESVFDHQPFYRMRVLAKQEIVSLGRPDISPHKQVGTYVTPEEWNRLIQQEDVTVLDVRNDYEVAIGHFKGAVDPKTKAFREFPAFVQRELDPSKHKKIAMSCTGGIRCEKASSYMLSMGFEEVYHLKGGVLKYLEETPAKDSLWDGECFVFDQRVSVKERVEPGSYSVCYGCRLPLSEADKCSEHYIKGVCCHHCHRDLTPEKRQRLEERHRQVLLAETRGTAHIGGAEAEH